MVITGRKGFLSRWSREKSPCLEAVSHVGSRDAWNADEFTLVDHGRHHILGATYALVKSPAMKLGLWWGCHRGIFGLVGHFDNRCEAPVES